VGRFLKDLSTIQHQSGAPRISTPVSVVVVTTGTAPTLRNTIDSVLKCEPLEVIVVSKVRIRNFEHASNVRVIAAPGLHICAARNLGISLSRGEILAFTDDDCVVPGDWLRRGVSYFQDETVAVVGGPGITHPDDRVMAKCAGAVLASPVGTFTSSTRYSARSGSVSEAKEENLSACNMFLRRAAIEAIGYFDEKVYPCEENELIERIRSSGKKCIYAPSCVVYHHRRPLFRPFLRQIRFYAFGRAVFAFQQPHKFRLVIAAPSLLVLSTLLLPIWYVGFFPVFVVLSIGYVAYLAVSLGGSVQSTISMGLPARYSAVVWSGIIALHYCYGASFMVQLAKVIWSGR
jgi:GT2 family glycosyltransferase